MLRRIANSPWFRSLALTGLASIMLSGCGGKPATPPSAPPADPALQPSAQQPPASAALGGNDAELELPSTSYDNQAPLEPKAPRTGLSDLLEGQDLEDLFNGSAAGEFGEFKIPPVDQEAVLAAMAPVEQPVRDDIDFA